MRNPTKFLYFFSLALVTLFAYGVHAMNRFYLASSTAKFSAFDRKWIVACAAFFGASVIGWVIYSSKEPALIHYLQKVGFGDEETAQSIAAFSVHQAAWFLCYFAAAILLSICVIAGFFSGKRARLGGFLIVALLVADLGRANLPFINFWNYKQKYESNPIVDFLREKSYEHRVIDLMFKAAPHLPQYDDYWEQLYRIEWIQQLFPYYNVQSLDIIQNPRPPVDSVAFAEALMPSGTSDSLYLLTRNWELSNNRYLLGPMAIQLPMGNVDTLDFLNNGLDPKQKRFHIVQRFDIVPKEGVERVHDLEQLTVATNDAGGCALFEFSGALPRAKLYSNWETNSSAALKKFSTNGLSASDLAIFNSVGTNDFLTLKKLASRSFDPWKTVLVPDSVPAPPAGTNENSGTVEFKSYSPNKIIFATQAATPTVLLVNSKYDANWRARVDGKWTPIFRANYIMRGVYLPPGAHTVEFHFTLPHKPLYITLAGIGVAILLCIGLIFNTRRKADRALI